MVLGELSKDSPPKKKRKQEHFNNTLQQFIEPENDSLSIHQLLMYSLMKRPLGPLSHVMAASHCAFMSSGKDEPNLQKFLAEAAGCFVIDFIPIEYTLFEHL